MGPLHLVNFAPRCHHALPRQHGCNLILGQCVSLDGRRATDRTNVIELSEPHAIRPLHHDFVSLQCGGNLHNEPHRLAAHCKLRNIFDLLHPLPPFQIISFELTPSRQTFSVPASPTHRNSRPAPRQSQSPMPATDQACRSLATSSSPFFSFLFNP